MTDPRREELVAGFEETRKATLALFDLLPEESVLHRSPGFGFRPLIWHLAHMGVFESYWILQRAKNEPAPDERYLRLFDPITTPREEAKDLPARAEMEDYLKRVRASVLDYLGRADLHDGDELLRGGYVFDLVLEHERQHQETLAYLLQLIDPAHKTKPATGQAAREASAASAATAREDGDLAAAISSGSQPEMIEIPGGEFRMGATWDAFAYDNETPAHAVYVPAFQLDRRLTTNAEFARFVAEGGYGRREWWSEEGWGWREKENWEHPLYWSREGKGWRVRTMFADAEMEPDHPVTGVSWYEAEAYARFRGKRLPTEAEWEKAASWDEAGRRKRLFAWGDDAPTAARSNFDFRYWGTTPAGALPQGASAYGCLDMTGNLWEWTASPFRGHPNFKPYPYPEYSELWFDDDHRVLKGGSWATRAPVLRTSFRNFFRRHFRIAFAGIRCAE